MKQSSTSCNHFGNLQINSNHGSLKSKVGLIQSLQAADVWQMLCCDVVRQKCRLTSSRICPNLQKFLGTSVDDGHPCIQHSNMCCRTYPFENGARICLNWPKVWLHEEAPAESVVDNDGSRWLWWRHEESSCIIELTIIDHPYPGFFFCDSPKQLFLERDQVGLLCRLPLPATDCTERPRRISSATEPRNAAVEVWCFVLGFDAW